MSVDDLRGFASIDAAVPVVVANTKDDARARAFTIVHEFGHLVLVANGVAPELHTERWCNEFAGEVLMPSDWLSEAFRDAEGPSYMGKVEQVARVFGVTPLAAAVRLRATGRIPSGRATRSSPRFACAARRPCGLLAVAVTTTSTRSPVWDPDSSGWCSQRWMARRSPTPSRLHSLQASR